MTLLAALQPALLADFAAHCVRSERLPLYAPQSLRLLASFALHRPTGAHHTCADG